MHLSNSELSALSRSMSAFKNWPQYIRIAIPSLLMLCLEWYAMACLSTSAQVLHCSLQLGVTRHITVTVESILLLQVAL